MVEQMRRQGSNNQTTVLHIDPVDLNVVGIFHNRTNRESSLLQNLGDFNDSGEGDTNFNQILQYLMEHDPKYSRDNK